MTVAALGVAAAIAGPAFAQGADPAGDIEIGAAPDPVAARRWLATAQGFARRAASYAANNRPDDAKAQLESAAGAYRKAIEASADLNLYLELAGVDERLGRFDDAVRDLRRVVRAGSGARLHGSPRRSRGSGSSRCTWPRRGPRSRLAVASSGHLRCPSRSC